MCCYGAASVFVLVLRALERKEVSVGRAEAEGDKEWFNVLALHQNRAKTAAASTSAVNDVLLPACMDIVVWGHERECTIGGGMDGVPDPRDDVQFSVLQPGSAVATELSEVEAKPKSVAILQVCGENWKLESHQLTTVRPYLTSEIVLDEHDDGERNLHNEEELRDLLAEKIDELIDGMRERHAVTPMTEHAESRLQCALPPYRPWPRVPMPSSPPVVPRVNNLPNRPWRPRGRYPIVRLRVDYTGFSTTNPQRFGQRFVERVANPGSLLHFHRRPIRKGGGAKEGGDGKKQAMGEGTYDPNGAPETDVPAQIQVGAALITSLALPPLLPPSLPPSAAFSRPLSHHLPPSLQELVGDFLTREKEQLRLLPRNGTCTHLQLLSPTKPATAASRLLLRLVHHDCCCDCCIAIAAATGASRLLLRLVHRDCCCDWCIATAASRLLLRRPLQTPLQTPLLIMPRISTDVCGHSPRSRRLRALRRQGREGCDP